MCLAVPAKVIEKKGSDAVVEIGGVKRKASLMLLPDVQTGDYVILHAGFAISKLDENEAKETLDLIKQL
ncbi:MAG: HypC/HybG/HupF family hydrogenase formation chaperone [Candidatus Omnitrophica bacterium]|nr:HypC/HybG/HupF family hydrogenase formation chaperone [Candidatus Omnitrophota bacterium]MCK4422713.1 HypC/HybG/HupF family hydrogenase formation chaperone [Candidatus Omnitrophota bacterium]